MPQTKEDWGGLTTKCNVLPWIWNVKRMFMKITAMYRCQFSSFGKSIMVIYIINGGN